MHIVIVEVVVEEAKRKMLKICGVFCLVGLIALALAQPPVSVGEQNAIQNALAYSNVVIGIIQNTINTQLPPEAVPQGEEILASAQENLAVCESLVQTAAQIWVYKQCAVAELQQAQAALRALQGSPA